MVGAQEAAARILVVEGDPEIRGTLDLLLGAYWIVVLADDARTGIELLEGSPFDLVISATQTPDLDGISLVRRLRARRATQDVPVILMSRGAGQGETIAGLEAGADDFLIKPFSGRELLVRVRTRLELIAMRRRNAQQEAALVGLERTLRARDEFFSSASHELRTPITTLGLQTEGLLKLWEHGGNGAGAAIDERLGRRLTSIRNQVLRLDQLVDQLLDVSRLIEGRLDLHPEEVDLQAVIRDAIDLMREPASRAGSPVVLHTNGAILGQWDKFRLGQVITNLLSNAIKFGCGKPIDVEVSAGQSSARFEVRDGGEGIAPEEQERIFQRFERVTSVQRHPGLGLGLWISKQIVEACRGTISVHSRRGEGCTFTVELPRDA